MSLLIVREGPLATVQDCGRPGWMHVGVSPSGAADRESHRLANALLGNSPAAATIEVLLGGLALEATTPSRVALTGADCGARVDGRAAAWATPVALRPGQTLSLGWATSGLRAYIAVAGGVLVPQTLGSRSRDTLSGLGPEPLHAGAILPTGRGPFHPTAEFSPAPRPSASRLDLAASAGPRANWSQDVLDGIRWRISPDSDRVAVRLEGQPLRRAASMGQQELPSEAVVRGGVQLPPSGLPLAFMADHPVTGGYPVIAVLDDRACDLLSQGRPGQEVSFRTSAVQR